MKIQDYKPNTMVLQCPDCQHALVKTGSKVERIHPVPKFCKNHYNSIVGANAILSCLIVAMGAITSISSARSAGYALVALFCLPSAVMFILVRSYSLYRITDCPYCGYHHKQKLGRFPIP